MTNKKENNEANGFYGLGIAPKLLDILELLKFTVPTPIQLKSIPSSIEGKDIVGIAQTGTGKTLAFGIPMLQRLAQHKGRGLVVLPTRELAYQVDENLKMIGKKIGLRTAVLIGGEFRGKQLNELKRNPHVIVATPGRLIDHLESKTIKLDDVKILVLDEADMMFDMGFAPQVEKILSAVPKERQTMLFSATMPPEIMKIITRHMKLPINIEVAPAGTPAESVEQEMIVVKAEEKIFQLEKALKEHSGAVLVFTRTKHGARKLSKHLNTVGYKAAEIHSNRTLGQRREALGGFKNGRYRILVATDIAARGIDVSGIELVVNFDLPDNSDDYVHRIGRTGRAGKKGKALSFVMPGQLKEVREIERLIKKEIIVTENGKVVQRHDKREFRGRGGKSTIAKYKGRRAEKSGNRASNKVHAGKRPAGRDDFLLSFNPFKEKGSGKDRRVGSPKKSFSDKRKRMEIPSEKLTDRQKFRRSLRSGR